MTATTSGQFPSHDMVARGYCNGRQVDVVAGLADLPGTGSTWTTATDLNRDTAALQNGQLLTAGPMAAMFTSHAQVTVVVPSTGSSFTAGTATDPSSAASTALTPASTPETTPAYQSLHAWLPDSDISVAALNNDESTDLTRMLKPLAATILR
jgi:hypothetical protein